MIKEIGSIYHQVVYVEDRIYIRVDDVDYAVQGEWIRFTYRVTKKGDVIVGARLATQQEIEEARKLQDIIELDKMLTEELNKVKDKFNNLKEKAKAKLKEFKDKIIQLHR